MTRSDMAGRRPPQARRGRSSPSSLELLSDRPLVDIGLMRRIAEQTAEANDDRGRA
jgi:hypothetical protein